MRALTAAPEQPVPPRYAAKPRPAHVNYRDFVITSNMRNCSHCNERHLDRDCPNRPPPEPIRAPATAASAGTADPPKQRASRPAAVPQRATAPEQPAAAPPPPPIASVPVSEKPAPALTTRRFAPARTPTPALSALRFGIEHTEIGWTSPHEACSTDTPDGLWALGAGYSRPVSEKPAPALTTRCFAPTRTTTPALSALRFGIEHTEIGWTLPHEACSTDTPDTLCRAKTISVPVNDKLPP